MNKIKKTQLDGYEWICDECNKKIQGLHFIQMQNMIIRHLETHKKYVEYIEEE